MIKHLKAFFTRQDMIDDWNKCVQSADNASLSRTTMTKDGLTTLYLYYLQPNDGKQDIEQAVMALELEKIHCDIRITNDTQWWLFLRLRSVNEQAKLTMEMFYKEIH